MSESNGIVWEEPQTHVYTRWNTVLEPLRERPNQWGRLKDYNSRSSAYGAQARLMASPKIGDIRLFEFSIARVNGSDSKWGLYARYVGEAS